MLDVEKHKNVGADMKTINDASLLDSLSERDTITEAEKVAERDEYELVVEEAQGAKEEYKLNEETLKRLDDNNFKRSFNELTGEYTLYSTIPDK